MHHTLRTFLTLLTTSLAPLATASPTDRSLLFARADCSTPYGAGTCVPTSSCTTGGFNVAGYCPGAADIQCCISKTCTTDSGSGTCMNTDDACSGSFVAGVCPGPTDIQCCVASGGGGGGGDPPPPPPPPPPPSGGDLFAIDLSSEKPSSFWSCAKSKGVQKVIPRGYQQACGSGGQVDPNMAASFKTAQAVGITNFDAYLYPCTGQSNNVECKPIQAQLDAFLAAVDDAGITPTHLWLDIEPTSTEEGAPCNSWQLGAEGNERLAKQWVAAIKASGRPWGIYANAGQWTTMFASESTDIGSDLPLWAVQFDYKPGVSTTTRFMGGWTKAYAKQYHLATDSDNPLCDASVDLNSFSG